MMLTVILMVRTHRRRRHHQQGRYRVIPKGNLLFNGHDMKFRRRELQLYIGCFKNRTFQ